MSPKAPELHARRPGENGGLRAFDRAISVLRRSGAGLAGLRKTRCRYAPLPDLWRYVRVQSKQVLRVVLGLQGHQPFEIGAVVVAIPCRRYV